MTLSKFSEPFGVPFVEILNPAKLKCLQITQCRGFDLEKFEDLQELTITTLLSADESGFYFQLPTLKNLRKLCIDFHRLNPSINRGGIFPENSELIFRHLEHFEIENPSRPLVFDLAVDISDMFQYGGNLHTLKVKRIRINPAFGVKISSLLNLTLFEVEGLTLSALQKIVISNSKL
jgi:hypothetical protein